MLKVSTATANAALNGTGLKEQFDDGFLYIFSGPVPATADEALNMASLHTEIVQISVGGDGTTGLTFAVPSGGVLGKTVSESWTGTAAFDGFGSASSTLTATFYRFCAAGDDGRGAANTSTGYRIQGVVGGPNSGAELQLGASTIANGAVQPIGSFGWTIGG